MSDDNFLSRWSRRKIEARTASPQPEERPAEAAPPVVAPLEPLPEPLPPVESLTPESDFTPFMKPEVDAGVKRQALKTLFQDPRFNVMDGLDVYIDDYSKPDPLPEGWLEKMNQVKRLGMFVEAPEKVPESPPEEPQALQAAIPEQHLAHAPDPVPSDTSLDEIPPAEVGRSEAGRE